MLQHILQYYTDEKSAFIYALSAGIIFTLIGVVLWYNFSVNPISKGFGTGLTVVGVILLAGGFSARYYNNKQIENLANRSAETEVQLQQSEIERMDKVMNVTFRYAFITFAVLTIALSLIVFLTKSFYWRGFTMAFILLVLFVWMADTYNAKRNGEYYEKVKAWK